MGRVSNRTGCIIFGRLQNRMNASDIVKAKQCGALYKAYYNPTILQGSNGAFSTIISTVTVYVSTSSGTTSTTSCINTVYPYICNPPVISYELANGIECGKFVCGGKVPSVTTWTANRAMGAINTFATSTVSTPISSINTSNLPASANLFAVRPLICPDPVFVQGTNFQSQCDVCNNFGAGVNACCHNCASGQ